MECIHGLEGTQCDICFPTAKPEPAQSKPVTRARSGTSARIAGAPRTRVLSPISVVEQRIYHLTHLDNLEFVLESGTLIADAEPAVDISTVSAREARRGIVVGESGAAVAAHVPFFLTPDADAWLSIRQHTPDPRISVDDDVSPTEFVLLVSSIGAIGDFVFADGEAAHPLTRFYDGSTDAAKRAIREIVADEDSGRIGSAEILVPGSVPFSSIALVAVANDRAKAAAKQALEDVGLRSRIAIHPPWFQR